MTRNLGVVGHELSAGLFVLSTVGVGLLVWPALRPGWGRKLSMGVVLGVLALGTAGLSDGVIGAAAACVILAVLACGCAAATHRSTLAAGAAAVAVLAVFHFATVSLPGVWLVADALGFQLGRVAGWLTGQPLVVGATFGGVDFLVTQAALLAALIAQAPRPRWRPLVKFGVVLLAGHLAYLALLSTAPMLSQAVTPQAGRTGSAAAARAMELGWMSAAHAGIPWNLPILAALVHASLALVVLRCLQPCGSPGALGPVGANGTIKGPRGALLGRLAGASGFALAVALPASVAWGPGGSSLEGVKVVVHRKGILNFERPEHGRYGSRSGGRYGMLSDFLALYGARCVISDGLSEADLTGANVLVVIVPHEPWPPGLLDRLRRHVEGGGSLLVLAEHTLQDADRGNPLNELLAATGMRVPFDSAIPAVSGWASAHERMRHPVTAGVSAARNGFGSVVGASVRAQWPAQPLLVGRWGWGDYGDEGGRGQRGTLGNWRYDAGERLGDIVLAAEEQVGRGKVVVFGDPTGFMNPSFMHSHGFVSRLFAYLGNHEGVARSSWRQLVALGLFAATVGWLVAVQTPGRMVAWGLTLGVSLLWLNHRHATTHKLVPGGERTTPNNLAYIDTGHLGLWNEFSWQDEGIDGFELTLMREGMVVLGIEQLSSERLQRAGVLVEINPTRDFSTEDRRILNEFVTGGGRLIWITGYDSRRASEPVLGDFGFRLGSTDGNEAQPLGYQKVPYLDFGTHKVHVRYHAPWQVNSAATNAEVIARGRGDVPVILETPIGKGKVVVIGDPAFVLNKNLEREDGQPIDGLRENAHFWRWYLAQLRDQPPWWPPKEIPVTNRPPVRASPPRPVSQPGASPAYRAGSGIARPGAAGGTPDVRRPVAPASTRTDRGGVQPRRPVEDGP